jgi:hypothetical protein
VKTKASGNQEREYGKAGVRSQQDENTGGYFLAANFQHGNTIPALIAPPIIVCTFWEPEQSSW